MRKLVLIGVEAEAVHAAQDLKSPNILLAKDTTAKIADVGLARSVTSDAACLSQMTAVCSRAQHRTGLHLPCSHPLAITLANIPMYVAAHAAKCSGDEDNAL